MDYLVFLKSALHTHWLEIEDLYLEMSNFWIDFIFLTSSVMILFWVDIIIG